MLRRLRDRFAEGRLAGRVARSAIWLVADRVIRSVLGFVVGVWVARHLGPEAFGQLSYALVLAGLLSMFVDLALESVVVRELVRRPDERAVILGTAFGLRMGGAVVGIAAVAAAAIVLRPNDAGVVIMCVAVAASYLTTPWYVAEFLLQSRMDARAQVLARGVGFLGSTAARIAAILAGAGAVVFAWLPLVEGGLTAVALVLLLRRDATSTRAWRFERAEARRLLHGAFPLIFAGLATLAASRVDQLIVGRLLGDDALGQFSAAARISETVNIVAAALGSALLPAVMALKAHQPERFHREVGRILAILFWTGLAIVLPIALFAAPVVQFLYGDAYRPAAPALASHVWSSLFTFIGTVIGGVLVAENLQRLAVLRSITGLVVVSVLVVVLAPRFGIAGAGWATTLGSAAMVYVLLLPAGGRRLGRLALGAPFGFGR